MTILSWTLLILGLSAVGVMGLDNGVARTPPMGWLSWERFLCNIDCANDPKNCINEQLYKDMADRLAADGYKEAGYEYVNVDDCWMSQSRDANGRLQPDPDRFPSGMKSLADYVHSKGLKLGIYQDCGTKTCGGYPGSQGYFDIDAQTYKEWEIDMLKMDGCYADTKKMDIIYPEMTLALNRTGRPIVFSCSWPAYQQDITPDYPKIAYYCNLWRNYNDISDSWSSVTSIVDYYDKKHGDLAPVSGPGQWNDPDMLVIGNFGLSVDQSQTQMALWAIFAAPLLMSNDLRDIRPEFRDILINKDVIAVNQDALGIMGGKVLEQNSVQFWTRAITPVVETNKHSYAIAITNRRDMGSSVPVTFTLRSLGLDSTEGYHLYDLYDNKKDMGIFNLDQVVGVRVNPSGVRFIKAEAISKAAQNEVK